MLFCNLRPWADEEVLCAECSVMISALLTPEKGSDCVHRDVPELHLKCFGSNHTC